MRRNAIYAALSIFKNVEFLMPDAPERVERLLVSESDPGCQRAAFIMLSHTEPGRADSYFVQIADKLGEMDGSLQLAAIEFLRQDVLATPENQVLSCVRVYVISCSPSCPHVSFTLCHAD